MGTPSSSSHKSPLHPRNGICDASSPPTINLTTGKENGKIYKLSHADSVIWLFLSYISLPYIHIQVLNEKETPIKTKMKREL